MQDTHNNNFITYTTLAAVYSCGAYSAGSYSNSECGTIADPGVSPGGLAETGYNVIIPVAFGLALVVAASILLIKRFIRKRSQRKDF